MPVTEIKQRHIAPKSSFHNARASHGGRPNPGSLMTTHQLESQSTDAASHDERRQHHDIDGMIWMLLAGVVLPPLLTLVNLQINHSLAMRACVSRSLAPLHLASFAILCAICFLGYRVARCLEGIWIERAVASAPGLMAMAGVFESAALATVIVTQWPPSQVLMACR